MVTEMIPISRIVLRSPKTINLDFLYLRGFSMKKYVATLSKKVINKMKGVVAKRDLLPTG